MVYFKYDNPIYILDDAKDGNRFYVGENFEYLSDSSGVVFGGEHYGISFTIQEGETFIFPTQCPIFGARFDADRNNFYLTVYEIGKTMPWKIDLTGRVIQNAKFLGVSRSDMKYLYENFGLGYEDLNEVNSYYEKVLKRSV